MMQRTQLLSITLVTIMVLAFVSGAGMLTATPAKAYYDTPTKIGDLVYLPEYYYPTAVDVGDVYAWDQNYYHISYVIAENPDHPWSSAGIKSVSLQAAWTYVAPGDNGNQIPAVNGQIEKMFFVPPYGDSNTQLNYASKYDVPPIPDPSAPTSDFCGKVAVWVTDTSGRQDSIGVWACKDTGSAFSYVADTGIMYLKYPPLNQPPIAEANGPYAGTAGQPVAFSSAGSSDADGRIASYSWNFGDGSTASTDANPSHIYNTAKAYTVTLTVTDDKGARASDTAQVDVTTPPNQPPVAEANGPYAGTAGQPVAFSSAGSSDPDGTIASYSWDFGDGSTASADANPSHTYTAAGTYTVTLTVTDDKGATATDKTHADVTSDPVPSVEAGGPYSTGAKNTVTLSGSATDVGALTYAWSVVSQPKGAKVQFSDATAANPTVTLSKAGTYTLQLVVTDYMGQKGVDTAQVTVGVVAAQQEKNPRQAGSSHIYFYDVAATDTHGKGKLQINVDKHTFEFNGQGFEPSAQIALRARAAGSSDYVVFATGKATPSGNLHVAGTWERSAVLPDEPGFAVSATLVPLVPQPGDQLEGTITAWSETAKYYVLETRSYGTFHLYGIGPTMPEDLYIGGWVSLKILQTGSDGQGGTRYDCGLVYVKDRYGGVTFYPDAWMVPVAS